MPKRKELIKKKQNDLLSAITSINLYICSDLCMVILCVCFIENIGIDWCGSSHEADHLETKKPSERACTFNYTISATLFLRDPR